MRNLSKYFLSIVIISLGGFLIAYENVYEYKIRFKIKNVISLDGIKELSKKENDICKKLESVLKANKLFFVGIDLIDQRLTEINVTSPTGIVQLRELYNVNVSEIIWGDRLSIV